MTTLPFITFEQNVYTIPAATQHFLESLDGPLAVVVICGPYRSGKSSLLNKCLLDCPAGQGFGVGNTISACTKGIWLSTQPIVTADGKRVLVLDAEGAFSLSANRNHDTKIFVLALLLSSYFIYNSVKSIDSTALQNLSMVTQLSQFVRTRKGNDSHALAGVMPALLWLIRDFSLQLVDAEGRPMTPNQYLDDALTPGVGVDEDTARVQTVMSTTFVSKECKTLRRPCSHEADLQNLDQLDDNAFRPEFLQELQELRQHIWQQAPVKKLGRPGGPQTVASGSLLYQLAAEYVATFNRGVCPVIEDTWTLVLEKQTRQLVAKLSAQYRHQLQQLPVTTLPSLQQQVAAAQQLVLDQFRQETLGGEEQELLQSLALLTDATVAVHQQQITAQIHQSLTAFQQSASAAQTLAALQKTVTLISTELEEKHGKLGKKLFRRCWLATQWDLWTNLNTNAVSALQLQLVTQREQAHQHRQEATATLELLRQLHHQEKTDWTQQAATTATWADSLTTELRQTIGELQQQQQLAQLELEQERQDKEQLEVVCAAAGTRTTTLDALTLAHQQLALDHQQLVDDHQRLQTTSTDYQEATDNELKAAQAALVQWRQYTVSVLEQLKSQQAAELVEAQQQLLQQQQSHEVVLQKEQKALTQQLEELQHQHSQQQRLLAIQHQAELQRYQKEWEVVKEGHLKERNALQVLVHHHETQAACVQVSFNANKRKLQEYQNSATEQKLRETNEKLLASVSSLSTKSEWLEKLYKQTQTDCHESSAAVARTQQQLHSLQRQHEVEILRLTLTHEMATPKPRV